MGGVCARCSCCAHYYFINGKLPGNKSSYCKSCEIIENRIKCIVMIKNYFKTAFRNLARNKVYSFINFSGLSIGLASAMFIMLYVKDEVSFDRFHKNVNNIYRIERNHKNGSTGFLQGP